MADCYRGILIQGEGGQRLPHQHGAPDDGDVLVEQIDLVILEELLHAARGSWQERVFAAFEPALETGRGRA